MLDEIVGKNVNELAVSKYGSLKAFCEEFNLDYQATWRLTKGKNSPILSTLERLADALEVNITEFFRE